MKILIVGGAGYVGSYLFARLTGEGYSVDVCDLGRRGFPLGPVRHHCSYSDLRHQEVAEYSHVLWFAGHASVALSVADPDRALSNNCIDLYRFARSLRPETRFVYASTGSLYSVPVGSDPGPSPPLPCTEEHPALPSSNAYDISKFAFDYVAKGFLRNFVGLRLGTVCGHSPNDRPELIFNAMNAAAVQNGKVQVSNPTAGRSLLFLSDLYAGVRRCIDMSTCPSGLFNMASLNSTIGEIANSIASFHGVPVELIPGAPTYSYAMDTTKAQQVFGIKFNGDLSHHCEVFNEPSRSPLARAG
jgi:nucleoside-diphosphate-sugar epimerase